MGSRSITTCYVQYNILSRPGYSPGTCPMAHPRVGGAYSDLRTSRVPKNTRYALRLTCPLSTSIGMSSVSEAHVFGGSPCCKA